MNFLKAYSSDKLFLFTKLIKPAKTAKSAKNGKNSKNFGKISKNGKTSKNGKNSKNFGKSKNKFQKNCCSAKAKSKQKIGSSKSKSKKERKRSSAKAKMCSKIFAGEHWLFRIFISSPVSEYSGSTTIFCVIFTTFFVLFFSEIAFFKFLKHDF